jgi:riboflavin biosynthesis pyrimidine reductase
MPLPPRVDPAPRERARAQAERLFGPTVSEFGGVSQVCATQRHADGRLHVLAIGPHAPRSELDFFGLNLARARTDAILTTAKILRSEPTLSHRLSGPHAEELAALRLSLGKAEPVWCALLTRSGEFPLEHPVWDDGTRKLVMTLPEQAAALTAKLGSRADVVGLPALSARSALVWLGEHVTSISVEAGPSTANALYDAPSLITELLLSQYLGAPLAPAALGRALPEDARLFAGLRCVHQADVEEPSGPWRFQRWLRST